MKNLLIIISIFLITACSKDDNSSEQTLQEPAKITTVYVGGSQTISGLEKATIWKNGVAQLLPTGATNASRVNSVYIYNDIVYAVGFEVESNVNIATLWIDSLKIALSISASESYSISGYKNTVYICGQLDSKSVFWVAYNNSTEIFPLSSTPNSVAKSIFVTNNGTNATGTYFAGKIGSNAWTYANPADITTIATNPSVAESVFVRGTDVFVAVNNQVLGFQTASLLKNGITQNAVASYTVMFSVHGDEQNIYAVGASNPNTVNSRAMIWENFIPKQLSQLYSQANSVFVANKNVYVAGQQYDSNSSKFKACLWINGTIQLLSNEKSETKSVFVTVK